MTHLQSIVTREKSSRVQLLVFLAFLGLAVVVGATSLHTVSNAFSALAQR